MGWIVKISKQFENLYVKGPHKMEIRLYFPVSKAVWNLRIFYFNFLASNFEHLPKVSKKYSRRYPRLKNKDLFSSYEDP